MLRGELESPICLGGVNFGWNKTGVAIIMILSLHHFSDFLIFPIFGRKTGIAWGWLGFNWGLPWGGIAWGLLGDIYFMMSVWGIGRVLLGDGFYDRLA